jgi:endogenous inhibitor of DNA gyrase (YacG/DUF329 family)
MEVNCPTCHKTVLWSKQAVHRPFCSERCKLIDLGGWAEGRYAIVNQVDEASECLKTENN